MTPRTPPEAIAFLASLPPSTIKLGFERVDAALAALGHPETKFPALHVAGTNGKGSTCAFAAAALQAAGHRVGLYTSPHLERLNERFQVGGVEISDEVLGTRVLEVLAKLPPGAELTFFELGTVVAFHHFAREQIDVGVIEVGLGGRLDATNRVQSTVSAITSISFDHQELLGHTLGAIAREKAGILKAGVPVVVARQATEALEMISACARAVGAPLYVEDREFTSPELPLSLRGPHQRSNAAVAWKCLELLDARGVRNTDAHRRQGLSTARWPGRLEAFGNVLLDGAHNPAGVDALLAALDPSVRPHLVFGVLKDKDFVPMIQALFPRCASVHLTALPSPRSWEPREHLAAARELCAEVTAYASPAEALEGARRCAGSGQIVAAGSLVLIGLLRALLR